MANRLIHASPSLLVATTASALMIAATFIMVPLAGLVFAAICILRVIKAAL